MATPDSMGSAFTLTEIRQLLSDGIRDLKNGKATPASVNALSAATGQIMAAVKLQVVLGQTRD